MKKTTVYLLITALVLTLLAGCGTNPAETSAVSEHSSIVSIPVEEAVSVNETTPEPVQDSSTEESNALPTVELPLVEDLTTITAWMTMSSTSLSYMNGYEDNKVIQEIENRTNVHVDFTTVNGSTASELFPVMIASGNYTDIIGSPTIYSGGVDTGIADGVFLDLTDDIAEYAPHYAAILESNEQAAREVKTATGRIATFRLLRENAFQYLGMAIRQDWLDELNLDMPETYDDLHDVLTAFRDQKGADAALWLNPMGVMPQNWFAAGFGISGTTDAFLGTTAFYPEDGTIKYGYAEDSFLDYLTMMNQWYSEGLIWQDFPTGGNGMSVTQSDGYNALLNNQMGVCFVQAGDIDIIAAEGIELMGMPEPVRNVGDMVHNIEMPTTAGASVAISADSEQAALVCRFLDYFFSEEGSLLCSYGIEGESYTMENGTPAFTDLILNNPEGIGFATALTIYALDDFPFLCDNARLLVSYSDQTAASIENWGKNVDGAWDMPTGVQLNAEESEIYNASYSDVSTYAMEMIPQFITGAKSLSSDYDTFVTTMYDFGLQTCIDLYQGAYDRYIAQ